MANGVKVATLNIEMLLGIAKLQEDVRNVERMDGSMGSNVNKSTAAITNSFGAVTRSAGQTRAGMQQLSGSLRSLSRSSKTMLAPRLIFGSKSWRRSSTRNASKRSARRSFPTTASLGWSTKKVNRSTSITFGARRSWRPGWTVCTCTTFAAPPARNWLKRNARHRRLPQCSAGPSRPSTRCSMSIRL